MKHPHHWIPSPLGHGLWLCTHCRATAGEISVIGDPNHCEKAPLPENPAAHTAALVRIAEPVSIPIPFTKSGKTDWGKLAQEWRKQATFRIDLARSTLAGLGVEKRE